MTIRSIRDAAAAVRGRRRELRLSQAELARRAGVSRKWVYEFEAGKSSAELGLLLRVLHELGLELALSARGTPVDPASGPIDLDDLLEEYQRDDR